MGFFSKLKEGFATVLRDGDVNMRIPNFTAQKNNISINGVTVPGDLVGRNIVVNNGKVTVDGKEIELPDQKIIHIEVHGNVENVENVSGNIYIDGNVSGGILNTSGEVVVKGSVGGNINTVSGDVEAEQIEGEVQTISGKIKFR